MSRSRWAFAGFLLLAFAARAAFGLTTDLWDEDQQQIYLIGVQFFTTGIWPAFGPDVVYTHTQLPGALQALLTGGPFYVLAQPEAPFILLNLLSLAALTLLAWYISCRLPDVPRWLLWPWVLTCPWALDMSTNIVNTSYLLAAAVPFFVSAIDVIAPGPRRFVPDSVAFFLMGFSLLWVFQIQMGYPVLLPFIGVALWRVSQQGRALRALAWFVSGAALAALTLIPTVAQHGLAGLVQTSGANIRFEPGNWTGLPLLVVRFFSFATFELPRFLPGGIAAFLTAHPVIAPFAVFAGVLGGAQTCLLIIGAALRRDAPDWMAIRRVTLAALGWLAIAFAFSIKGPASHTFYLVFPLVTIYAFYVWAPWLRLRLVRVMAAALLICGAIVHVAIARDTFKTTSLYTKRPLVVRALDERNYLLLGERRPDIWRKMDAERK